MATDEPTLLEDVLHAAGRRGPLAGDGWRSASHRAFDDHALVVECEWLGDEGLLWAGVLATEDLGFGRRDGTPDDPPAPTPIGLAHVLTGPALAVIGEAAPVPAHRAVVLVHLGLVDVLHGEVRGAPVDLVRIVARWRGRLDPPPPPDGARRRR